MNADEFEASILKLRVNLMGQQRSPAEIERCLEPYHTFLAIMRENDVEDAERAAAGHQDGGGA